MRLRNNKTTKEFGLQPSILEPEHFSDSQSSSAKKFDGVCKLKDGFCARTPCPKSRKQLCLGSFKSAEDASMVVLAKKTELEEKQRKTEEKQRIEEGICDEEINKAVDQSDQCLGGDYDDPCRKNQDSLMQIGSRKLRIAKKKESCDFSGRKIDGVRKAMNGEVVGGISKSKSGKYIARIRHPISKKQIWLGTFGSGEEASVVCSEKKAELEKELKGKKRKRVQGGVCDEEIKKFVDQSGQCLDENGTNICEENQVDSRKEKTSKNKKKNQDSSLKIDARKARISEGTVVGLVGVSKSKSGKYVAKIKHPKTRKDIWLGTFGTAEEASMAFLTKKTELRKEMQGKGDEKRTNHLGPILDESNHDPCLNNQDSAMKTENIDSLNGESASRMENLPIQRNVEFVEKEVSVDSSVCSESGAEILLRTESGVPLMDSHGYLLGSWSWIDDLSLPIM